MEFEKKESFGVGTKGSHVWDRDKVKAVIQKLKEEDDGSVREIPMSWFWSNIRISQSPIKYTGFYAKKLISDMARALNIIIEVRTNGCKNMNTEEGILEIQFK